MKKKNRGLGVRDVLPKECGNLKSGITRSHLRLHPVRVVGNEGFRHYPKKDTKEKNVSSNGEGCKKISRDNGRKGWLRERRKGRWRRIGRRVRRAGVGGYLVPMFPVVKCLLDLVPYTCVLQRPTAKIFDKTLL
jgi:hypothetical protein